MYSLLIFILKVPGPGIEPGTLHFKVQYSTTRPSRAYKINGTEIDRKY